MAETAAEEALLQAELAAEQAVRMADAEAEHFAAFLDRYRADPTLTTHLFCRDLVAGAL